MTSFFVSQLAKATCSQIISWGHCKELVHASFHKHLPKACSSSHLWLQTSVCACFPVGCSDSWDTWYRGRFPFNIFSCYGTWTSSVHGLGRAMMLTLETQAHNQPKPRAGLGFLSLFSGFLLIFGVSITYLGKLFTKLQALVVRSRPGRDLGFLLLDSSAQILNGSKF